VAIINVCFLLARSNGEYVVTNLYNKLISISKLKTYRCYDAVVKRLIII